MVLHVLIISVRVWDLGLWMVCKCHVSWASYPPTPPGLQLPLQLSLGDTFWHKSQSMKISQVQRVLKTHPRGPCPGWAAVSGL